MASISKLYDLIIGELRNKALRQVAYWMVSIISLNTKSFLFVRTVQRYHEQIMRRNHNKQTNKQIEQKTERLKPTSQLANI